MADCNFEFLAFPGIFAGHSRRFGCLSGSSDANRLTYKLMSRWELRSVDRRAAMNVANIFFKVRKQQMEQVRNIANFRPRMGRFRSDGTSLRAGGINTKSLEAMAANKKILSMSMQAGTHQLPQILGMLCHMSTRHI